MRNPSQRAQLLADILFNSRPVLRRRKVGLELVSTSWHRRCLTLDVHFDAALIAKASARELDRVPVPVSLSEKSPGRSVDYDLEASGVEGLRLPTTSESRALIPDLIVAAAQHVCVDIGSIEEHVRALKLLEIACVASSPTAEQSNLHVSLLEGERVSDTSTSPPHFARLPQDLVTHERFRSLMLLLCDRDLMVLDLPTSSQDYIVKMSCVDRNGPLEETYSDPIRRDNLATGREPYRLRVRMASWDAESTHVEVRAPEGARLYSVAANVVGGTLPVGTERPLHLNIDRERTRAHLYETGESPGVKLDLNVDFGLARAGFVRGALWVATAAALATTTTAAVALSRVDAADAVAVLAIVPSLAAPFVTHRAENEIVQSLLNGIRRTLMLAALVSFFAGAAATLGSVDPHRWWLGGVMDTVLGRDRASWYVSDAGPVLRVAFWLGLTAVAWFCLLRIYAANKFPRIRALPLLSPLHLVRWAADAPLIVVQCARRCGRVSYELGARLCRLVGLRWRAATADPGS